MCQKQLFGRVLAIFVGWLGKPSTISAELPESVPGFVPFWECNYVRMALTGNARTPTQGSVLGKINQKGPKDVLSAKTTFFLPLECLGNTQVSSHLGPLFQEAFNYNLCWGIRFPTPDLVF